MDIINKKSDREKLTIYFVATFGFLVIGWLVYLFSFYYFYKENYFYVDKKQSILLQIISLLANNWEESIVYFLLSFVLTTVSLMIMLFYYSKRNDKRHKMGFIFCFLFTIGCFIKLMVTVYGAIFIGIWAVSASFVYVWCVCFKKTIYYEDGEVVAIKGPYETGEKARQEAELFIENCQKQKRYRLINDIYIDLDNKYYAEIYAEVVPKFER